MWCAATSPPPISRDGSSMKDTLQMPRSRFRTVFVVVAPSVIFLIGGWLVGIASFMLSEDPFQPNLMIMVGGTVVVVTMAVGAIIFIDRSKRGV